MASWRLIAAQVLIALLAVPPPAGAVPAVSFEFGSDGCGPSNVEGWQFQTSEALTVSALGAYDDVLDGLDRDIPVGLFDASCALVASVTVPQGQAAPLQAQYRYVAIAPVVLAAGQTYRIAALVGCDDFSPAFQTLDTVVLHPGLTGVSGRRIAFGDALACPTESGSGVDFAANFIIAPPCGNGIVQQGEECDDGNSDDADCCTNACTPQNAGEPCPPDDQVCTVDRCTADGVCAHTPGNAGTACRPPDFDCDAAETCDGVSPLCPEGDDEYAPDGTPCTDDGLYCSGEEACNQGECTGAGNPCEDLAATCDEDADQCVAWTPTATVAPTASTTPVATATRTASATAPPSATSSPIRTSPSSPTLTPIRTVPSPCRGDCDVDGAVTINELITAVTIALGAQPLSICPSLDSSANTTVEINELIGAVANALDRCS